MRNPRQPFRGRASSGELHRHAKRRRASQSVRASLFAWTANVELAIGAIRTVRFAFFARRCLLFGTVAIVFWIAGPRAGNAASLLWSPDGVTPGGGGTGTWNTSTALWYNGTSFQSWTNAPVNDAVFGGSAGTVTLGVPITVENLTFNTSGYTIAGSTLTLGGVTPTVSVVSSGTATIGSVIAGTVGLVQAGGTGTLILTGTNTYTEGRRSMRARCRSAPAAQPAALPATSLTTPRWYSTAATR